MKTLSFSNISKYFNEIDKECCLVFLGMTYATVFFCSFVMGYKAVSLYGRLFCSSVFIFPLLFPLNDAITEIIGAKVSYFMIVAIIVCEFTFAFITHTLALLPSPIHWKGQETYLILTGGFINIAIADSISLAIGFFANTYILDKWGIKIFGSNFFLRSLGCTAIGELLFTISTNLLAFHYFSAANIEETIDIIASDYLFKLIYSIIICIPNAYLVSQIKKNIHRDEPSVYLDHKIININRVRLTYRT